MLRYFLVTVGLPIIFITGFVAGMLWQARHEASRDLPPPRSTQSTSIEVSSQTPATTTRHLSGDPNKTLRKVKAEEVEFEPKILADEDSIELREHQLAEAMKDPEFKKLHDHIMHGQAQEWKLPTLPTLPDRSVPSVKE